MDLTSAHPLIAKASRGWADHQPRVQHSGAGHEWLACRQCRGLWPCDAAVAYRAGREDAARERDEAIKMLADLVVKCTEYGTQDGEFVAMYLLPTGPVHRAIPWLEERGVIVRPGLDGRKAISLGRSVQGDGDSPEEQRPSLQHQERSEERRLCSTLVCNPGSPEPFWCNKAAGHSGPHRRAEEQR